MGRGPGKRLTEEQISGIKNAPATETLAEIAKKFNTSLNTVQRYRSGAKKAAQPKAAATKSPAKPAGFDALIRQHVRALPLKERLEIAGIRMD